MIPRKLLSRDPRGRNPKALLQGDYADVRFDSSHGYDLEGTVDDALDDEWGAEVFYNFAITPAIQLTFDLQYLNSGAEGVDDALVFGLRLFTQF